MIMKKLMIALFALTSTLSFFTSCSSDSASDSTPVEAAKNYSHSTLELDLLDEVNTYRVSVGLNPLQIIEHISYKSNEHKTYMVSIQDVNHDGFNERKTNLQQVLGTGRVGGSVAYAYSPTQTTVAAWVNSPSHKANLEGDYTHFGASIKIDDEGKKYYTNMFIKK